MRYIFHISDIHIDIDRVENLMNSFNILVRDILAKGVEESMLVILGDIFEHKTILTTNDLSIFDRMMRKLHAHGIRTIIIVGNHDFNINRLSESDMEEKAAGSGRSDSKGLSDSKGSSRLGSMGSNRPDLRHTISLEILTQGYKNVKCLTYTSVYVVENVEFHVYSIVDGGIPKFHVTGGRADSPGRIKIALMHDGVNNAKYDTGQIIEGMRFGISDFDKYDYTMLGDIHRPQFLTETMAYCGSFVQKNRGEGVDHGYILWDLAWRSLTGERTKSGLIGEAPRFNFIPMKNLTIKIIAYEDRSTSMPDIVAGQTITYVQLWHRKCTSAYVADLTKRIKDKYHVLHRVVNRDLYELTRSDPASPVGPEGPEDAPRLAGVREIDHEACIRDLLKAHSAEDIEAVIKMHHTRMQSRNDVHYANYRINYLSWSNVLCYGENNYIDFSNVDSSIVVLNGKNKYGKSSIIDILIRILFNECDRGYKKDIVNKNKSSGHIKISISVPAGVERAGSIMDEYIIEQVMDKTNTHTQHRLYKNGENITKQTIVATYEYINKGVGVGSYSDFINMTTALQNRKFLVDLKEEEMLGLLIKLLNIETDEINREVKVEQRNRKRDAKMYDEDLTKITESIAESKDALEKLGCDSDTLENLSAEISEMKREYDSKNAQLQDYNRQYDTSLPDISEADLIREMDDLQLRLGGAVGNPSKLLDMECKKAVMTAELSSIPPIPVGFESDPQKLQAAEALIQAHPDIDEKLKKLASSIRYVEDPTRQIAEVSKKIADLEAKIAEVSLLTNYAGQESEGYSTSPNITAAEYLAYSAEYKNYLSDLTKLVRVDQIDLSDLTQMKSRMDEIGHVNRTIVHVNINIDVDIDDRPKYEKLLAEPLPDYESMSAECKSAQARVDKFNASYGAMQFDAACACCRANSEKLAEFNIDTDIARIAELTRILADQCARTQARQEASIKLNAISQHEYRFLHLRTALIRYARALRGQLNSLVCQLPALEGRRIVMDINARALEEIARLEELVRQVQDAKMSVVCHQNFTRTTELKISLKKIGRKIVAAKMSKRLEMLGSIQQNQATAANISAISADLSKTALALDQKSQVYQVAIAHNAAAAEKRARADELRDKISDNARELRLINLYQKCVDASGISQKILADLCGVFNLECNRILHQISDFEIEILIEKPRTLKIYTVESGIKIPAAMSSGYQKFVIDIIMRVVLTTILCGGMSNNMSNPGMLIIDEGFGCLDSKNFTEVAGVLKQLKRNFRCIMIITHIPELKEYADVLIDIQRNNGYSRMTFGDEERAARMLHMTILDENARFAEALAESRVEKNEAQAAKRAEITAKKDLVVQAKTAKRDAREEARAKKEQELQEKIAAKEAKKAAVLAERESAERKAAELVRVLASDALIRERLIVQSVADGMAVFTCSACGKTYKATEKRITDHVTSASYKPKHRNYIKSII